MRQAFTRSNLCLLVSALLMPLACTGDTLVEPVDDQHPAAADQPIPRTVSVLSSADWQRSGIQVVAGQQLTLAASGEYRFHADGYTAGPAGIAEAEPFLGAWPANELAGLALIGRIGPEGEPFLVGEHAQHLAQVSGELAFMVNDDIRDENEGALQVEIAVTPAGEMIAPAAIEAQQDDAATLRIEEIAFTMAIPDGWRPGGASGKSILASYTAGASLYPGLSVTIEDRMGRDPEGVHTAWIGLLPDPTVESLEERTVSGRPALLAKVSWNSVLGELRAIRLVIELDERVLVVTFADRANDLDGASETAYREFLGSATLDG